MVYLSNLMQVSAQEAFITYEHVTSLFPTAHLTVNLQYYEISLHVVATALEVMCKYKYCRGVFRCNSDPPNIKFNPSMLALLPVQTFNYSHAADLSAHFSREAIEMLL